MAHGDGRQTTVSRSIRLDHGPETVGQGGRYAAASGQRLCRRCRVGSRVAGDRGEFDEKTAIPELPATHEQRLCISSLAADATAINRAVRQHWGVKNSLYWCMDVVFADDQMRTRSGLAAHNLAVLKHITLNLIRLDPVQRKGGISAWPEVLAIAAGTRAR
jgi:predicted transposase YbfD/YdcC